MRVALVSCLVAAAAAFGQPGVSDRPQQGTIEGLVLDGAGNPLVDATVYAQPDHDMRRQIRGQTDAAGRFVLRHVPAGWARVQAFKESAGYPYTFFAFFLMPKAEPIPRVEVHAGRSTEGVTIRLGVKAAVLKLHIRDEQGRPRSAGAEFERPDLGRAGHYGTSVEADQTLLVPPVPFRLSIESDGYATWFYGGDRWQEDDGLVILQSGETLELSVTLKLGSGRATQTQGAIEGTVFDYAGELLSAASVRAEPQDDSGQRRETTSTPEGTFVINGVPPGTYQLSAWKGAAGYSSKVSSPFFWMSERQLPTVAVAPADVTKTEIRLGPQDGFLHLRITDQSGKPLSDAKVVLARPDSPDRLEHIAADGRAYIPVPPTTMRVSVEADGFAVWHLGGDRWREANGLLTVRPRETVDLEVRLQAIR